MKADTLFGKHLIESPDRSQTSKSEIIEMKLERVCESRVKHARSEECDELWIASSTCTSSNVHMSQV